MEAQIVSCAALAVALSMNPAVAGKIIGNGRGCGNPNTEVNNSSNSSSNAGKASEQKQSGGKAGEQMQEAAVQGKCLDKITVSNGQSKAVAAIVAPQARQASGEGIILNAK